jgi:hypothetical protein
MHTDWWYVYTTTICHITVLLPKMIESRIAVMAIPMTNINTVTPMPMPLNHFAHREHVLAPS